MQESETCVGNEVVNEIEYSKLKQRVTMKAFLKVFMNAATRLIMWSVAGLGLGASAIWAQSFSVARVPQAQTEKRDGVAAMSLIGALQEQSRGAILVDVESSSQKLAISGSVLLRDANALHDANAQNGRNLILLGGETQWKRWSANRRVIGAVPSHLLRRATGLQPRDEVSTNWLQAQLQSRRVRVLDLREADEWAQSHLRGSQQVSLFDVGKRLRRDEPVALLCLTGHRSAWALKQLRAQGFRRVVSVRGGWLEWKAQGRPLLEQAASSTRYE